jgi:integrase
MRLGECLALQWGDVDLEHRVVIVSKTIDWQRHANTPKGGVTKDLPLSMQAAEALTFLANHPERPRSAYVFTNGDGMPWSRVYVRRVMHRTCLEAGIALRTVHSFRRTFLTRLAESGANPWAVRDLARHRSITTTEGYLRMNLRHRALVDAAERTE